MKRKVCKDCRIFVDGKACPICKGSHFTTNWKGRITVIDPKKSDIAHKVGIKRHGEYVIKVPT